MSHYYVVTPVITWPPVWPLHSIIEETRPANISDNSTQPPQDIHFKLSFWGMKCLLTGQSWAAETWTSSKTFVMPMTQSSWVNAGALFWTITASSFRCIRYHWSCNRDHDVECCKKLSEKWSVSSWWQTTTNQRPVFKSRDHSRPIRRSGWPTSSGRWAVPLSCHQMTEVMRLRRPAPPTSPRALGQSETGI